MRIYHGATSPEGLRKARSHAPSHTHGFGWSPAKMTPHDVPYFLDNGAYTGSFDKGEWIATLRQALEMPRQPDFVVYPDVFGDAEGTRERVRSIFSYWSRDEIRLLARFQRYVALQPGMSIDSQLEFAHNVGAAGVFVGGPKRWKRSHGTEIVRKASAKGFKTHVGNPSGQDGFVWAYTTGFDSCDTTSVVRNENWHWLDALESATQETGSDDPPPEQARLIPATDGGTNEPKFVDTDRPGGHDR